MWNSNGDFNKILGLSWKRCNPNNAIETPDYRLLGLIYYYGRGMIAAQSYDYYRLRSGHMFLKLSYKDSINSSMTNGKKFEFSHNMD